MGLRHRAIRKNADGSPCQSHLLAGENIIGLHLRGVAPGPPSNPGPRIGIAVDAARFAQVQDELRANNYPFTATFEHGSEAPLARSIFFDDPEGNHLELCVRRVAPLHECISHVVFETRDLKKSMPFYTEALGTGVPMACGDETMIPLQSGQMVGLVEVGEPFTRSKKHGHGCCVAMAVQQEDFDSMAALVERYGGKHQDNGPADGTLKTAGKRSTYIFDPDANRLQITAHAAHRAEQLLADGEKWRRIVAGRKEPGRGWSRWESSGK